MSFEAFQDTFWKYVLVVVLFAVFLGLAQLQASRSRPSYRRHRRRRHSLPHSSSGSAGESGADGERPGDGEDSRRGGRGGLSLGLSVVAILLCIAALVVMWYAATLAALTGQGS
ncbi:MAG: SelK/SelG family selenoprotein [Deltaproteobacteria bacterium]|nr:MAG: SelK/SelG family selenoprotein [Deltaproteobacteria bacterium]